MFINIGMVDYLQYICVWIIIKQEIFDVSITHKITINLIRNIVITRKTKNCAGICGCYGVKVFISVIGFDNIYLAQLLVL